MRENRKKQWFAQKEFSFFDNVHDSDLTTLTDDKMMQLVKKLEVLTCWNQK